MRKRFLIITCVIIIFFMVTSQSMAATKEAVIATLNASYQVGEETFTLPDRIRTKMVNFIENKDDLTESQCDQLIYFANRAYEIAKNAGTTDVTQMEVEDVKEGIGLLVEASNTVEIDLEKELAEENITLPNVNDIGKGEITENTNENNLVTKEETISSESGDIDLKEEIALSSGKVNPPTIVTSVKEDEITPKINKILVLAFVLVFVVFLVAVLLLRLVIKAKWHVALKAFFITLLALLILASVLAFIILIVYYKTIRLTLRLYYMFL